MVKKVKTHLSTLTSRIALLSVEMLAVLIAFIAAMFLVVVTVREIFWKQKDDFDFKVFDLIQPLVSDGMTTFMQLVTFFGDHKFLIPAYLILITWFLAKKEKWYSIKIPAVGLTSMIIMFGLKQIFNRPRPLIPLLKQVGGLSFPSGHAFMSFSFFALLIYIVYRHVENTRIKWAIIVFLLLFIATIGFSRIYLRVHYASDVVAGFSLGLMWLVISILVLRKIEDFSRRKLQPEPPAPDSTLES